MAGVRRTGRRSRAVAGTDRRLPRRFRRGGFIVGWLSERGWDGSVSRLFVAMAVGHVVILAMGFAWLAFGLRLGLEKAWLVGVVPFIAASLIKNALGAALVPALRRLVDGRTR